MNERRFQLLLLALVVTASPAVLVGSGVAYQLLTGVAICIVLTMVCPRRAATPFPQRD